ncbi:hypothetical protein EIN_172730 [Entamoeba invadens IP1]|uniref:Uncharacterized protein n=1 Tax=Entamoeba invadens IP1 TaxID=370355 RepID=A0A0A1U143_ENTIV|nr:hypothetical protein EIN_172730 [Entamoeba invadens IP1]ELP84628.1 hypothetical protein EIN_172730 [Entamoeba invadens IP1]|eukprot:XP_004183974.1 hypothetical protein EIN_172730 [Entamoeba invadens IP1]
MTHLEMVYLMNIGLFIPHTNDIFVFINVSKKCQTAIRSLLISPWYNQKLDVLFSKRETLSIQSFHQYNPIVSQLFKSPIRVEFLDPPILSEIPDSLVPLTSSGINFPRSPLSNFFELKRFIFQFEYDLSNLQETETTLMQNDWDGLASLPKLKIVIINCIYKATPFLFSFDSVHSFNNILVQLTKKLTSHGNFRVVLEMKDLDDYCVNKLKTSDRVFMMLTGVVTKSVVNALLNNSLIIKNSRKILFSYSQVIDGTFERLSWLYAPSSVILRSVDSYHIVLSPEESEDEIENDGTVGTQYFDFSKFFFVEDFDVLFDKTHIEILLPTENLKRLSTNCKVINLPEIQLESLEIRSFEEKLNFPQTLKDLSLFNSPLTEIEVPERLENCSIMQCDKLVSLKVPENVTQLRVTNCSFLTQLTIPKRTRNVTLINIGIKVVTLPTTLTFMCIGRDVIINNEADLKIHNSFLRLKGG